MEQVADIDSGLEEDPKETEKVIQDNIAKLSKNIDRFNREIGDYSDDFNREMHEMIDHLKAAAKLYDAEKGQLTDFLKVRRELMYLEALIRKFKSKIMSLQLMNNVLFSFSQEMKNVKDAYKSNLVNVSSEMTEAKDLCTDMIGDIEKLN
jgi:prefoldin subunit 5